MLSTGAPSAMSLIGDSGVPDLVIAKSASVRSPPVKHTVLPGAAASRAARTSSDRVIVWVQFGGKPWLCWLGPEPVHAAVSRRLSASEQTDSVRIPPRALTVPG